MPKSYEIKPNKTAFVTYRFVIRSFYSLIVFTILYSIVNKIIGGTILYFIITFILLSLLNYYILNIKYDKEKYIFFSNKIIHKSGSLFSDAETELVIYNITQVSLRLPFIENKLFETGNIKIESAGSGKAEIYLSSINKPKQIYGYIEKIMQYIGFNLKKSELIQQEKPSTIGVFFEVFKSFIGTLFIIFYVGFYIISESLTLIINFIGPFLIIGIVLLLLYLFIRSIFQFLDLKRRIYNIYSDTITYSEGFLSKNYSFIPTENLADSTISQTLIDKLFGLYDVKISCQGSKQEILFKNIVNGPKMENNIDTLISKSRSLIGTEKHRVTKTAKIQKQAYYQPKTLQRDSRFTAEYRMDGKRTIIPLLILLPIFTIIPQLLVFWIIMLVSMIIKMSYTKYLVKPRSMEERYDFITSKHKEYTNDKITGIIFRENFIDKWFNTCSISFWSIGSAESIKFQNIKKSSSLYGRILAKSGIKPQQILHPMNSHFKVTEMLKSTLPLTTIAVFILIGSFIGIFLFSSIFIIPIIVIFIVYTLILIYKNIYYKRSKLAFFKDYIYFTRGIFFKDFYYVLRNNIKGITTIKYPFSRSGSVKFNVAGEQIVEQRRQSILSQSKFANSQLMVSNHFKINYIRNIDNKDELIDLIFYKNPNAQQISHIEQNIEAYSPKSILVSKQDLGNTLVPIILLSLIFFPLLPIMILALPIIIWSIKVRSYIIQPYRVLAKSGILYKKQISIIFNKINHINFDQGMLNKLFKNGNIEVNTTGSSKTELTIKNIPTFKEFYGVLKKYY